MHTVFPSKLHKIELCQVIIVGVNCQRNVWSLIVTLYYLQLSRSLTRFAIVSIVLCMVNVEAEITLLC